VVIQTERHILPVIVHLLNRELGGHEALILDYDLLLSDLAYEEALELELVAVDREEGVLADGAQLEHLVALLAFREFADSRGDHHPGLLGGEPYLDLLLLLGG